MQEVFLEVVRVSLYMSIWILLLGGLAKILGKRYGVRWRFLLWMALAIRLAMPINMDFYKPLVVIPAPQVQQVLTQRSVNDEWIGEIKTLETARTEPLSQGFAQQPQVAKIQPQDSLWNHLLANLWVAWVIGVACFLGFYVWKYVSFRKMLRRSRRKVEKAEAVFVVYEKTCAELGILKIPQIYVCEMLSSPLCIGFLQPQIYLNQMDLTSQQIRFICKHELTHLKCKDIWKKVLFLWIEGLHFFNPLVHWMVRLANRDMEYACDARVLQDEDMQGKEDYALTILASMRAGKGNTVLATSFLSTKDELKLRFSNLFDKQPKKKGSALFIAILICMLTCIGMVGCKQAVDEALSYEEQLMEYAGTYIGDNVNVGAILNLLSLPEGVNALGFALDTEKEPYGLIRNISIDEDSEIVHIVDGERYLEISWMEEHADWIFKLVDNADYVEYNCFDNGSQRSETYRIDRNEPKTQGTYVGDVKRELREVVRSVETEGLSKESLAQNTSYQNLVDGKGFTIIDILRIFEKGEFEEVEGKIMMAALNDIYGYPMNDDFFSYTPEKWLQLYRALDSFALPPFIYDANLYTNTTSSMEGLDLINTDKKEVQAVYQALSDRYASLQDAYHITTYSPYICRMEEAEEELRVFAILHAQSYVMAQTEEWGRCLVFIGSPNIPVRLTFVKQDGAWVLSEWYEAEDSTYASMLEEIYEQDIWLAEELMTRDGFTLQQMDIANLELYFQANGMEPLDVVGFN